MLSSKFPEYYTNSNDDVYPDKDVCLADGYCETEIQTKKGERKKLNEYLKKLNNKTVKKVL
jgi:hypothetical protein